MDFLKIVTALSICYALCFSATAIFERYQERKRIREAFDSASGKRPKDFD